MRLTDLDVWCKRARPYLYYEDQRGQSYTLDASGKPRQYIRRLLAAQVGIGQQWDWRRHPFKRKILRTLAHWHRAHRGGAK
jgi:hypothetical protein